MTTAERSTRQNAGQYMLTAILTWALDRWRDNRLQHLLGTTRDEEPRLPRKRQHDRGVSCHVSVLDCLLFQVQQPRPEATPACQREAYRTPLDRGALGSASYKLAPPRLERSVALVSPAGIVIVLRQIRQCFGEASLTTSVLFTCDAPHDDGPKLYRSRVPL